MENNVSATAHSGDNVVLADGTACDIGPLGPDELLDLQWQQERTFARRILDAPKGSTRRADAMGRAYDTVNRIVAARMEAAGITSPGQPVALGMHDRYERLVVQLLARQRARGLTPRFFEIGYGSGGLLKRIADRGFPVAGIEISPDMHRQAAELMGPEHEADLLQGDFLRRQDASRRETGQQESYSLIYWNDVIEHIPPDEVADYLKKIVDLLVPGGLLVTISPNWHVRPSDVTGDVLPPRTESAGLHLKEYTLREMTALLRGAGLQRVAVPLLILPGQPVLCGSGMGGIKRRFEPLLEYLPFRLATLLCRGFGLSTTIAAKGR